MSPLICIAFFSQKDTCKKPTFSHKKAYICTLPLTTTQFAQREIDKSAEFPSIHVTAQQQQAPSVVI
jgi:hypothetical protein